MMYGRYYAKSGREMGFREKYSCSVFFELFDVFRIMSLTGKCNRENLILFLQYGKVPRSFILATNFFSNFFHKHLEFVAENMFIVCVGELLSQASTCLRLGLNYTSHLT